MSLPSTSRSNMTRALRVLHSRADHMVMAVPMYYSADMVRALPEDGNRYETVHGELLVTPAPGPKHQWVVGEVHARIREYLARHHPGWAIMASPADISWDEPDVLVQPDLFVVQTSELLTWDWSRYRTLALAVEVLSPSSHRADRFTKRRVYQEHHVAEYWVVDIEGRAIEVWTPAAPFPRVERDRITWQPGGADQPLDIAIAEIVPA